jgi:hypothetical protein
VREIQRVQSAQGVPVTDPEWLVFDSHSPFMMHAKPEAIKGGLYKEVGGAAARVGREHVLFWGGVSYAL